VVESLVGLGSNGGEVLRGAILKNPHQKPVPSRKEEWGSPAQNDKRKKRVQARKGG